MNIYFSGIGGVGIGSLAEIACDAGHTIMGSDRDDSLTLQELRTRNIAISLEQDGSFLRECHQTYSIDWFVHTAALPADHPELRTARELGLKISKRDELLATIIKAHNLQLIAIAGTHGKTTTTGMLIWAFKKLGIPISYSIGTTVNFGPSGAFDPASKYFVYECDEFDRNFLHFSPHIAVIPSLGYDHPDTYPTEGDYKQAFAQFFHNSRHGILWSQDASYIKSTPESAWVLQDSDVLPIPLAGAHNRRNATLVAKALEYLQLADSNTVMNILGDFPGTNRRFEKLADNLYSDYAHHPTEIAATLQMASELSSQIIAVYQPHQNVRQHQIKDRYTNCFDAAEHVYWLPTYLTREDPVLLVLNPKELASHLTNKNITFAALDDELWNILADARQNGKLILLLGAGSIDTWARRHLTGV